MDEYKTKERVRAVIVICLENGIEKWLPLFPVG